MKRFTSLMLMLLVAVTTMWAGPTDLPLITTDESNPIYYTIVNTRSSQPGGYMYFAGENVGLKDEQVAKIEAKHKFYFTGSHDALYVHNAATDLKLASVGSWTTDGTAWAVGVSPKGGGLAFGPQGGLNGNSCWNEKNYSTDENTSDFTTWSANDAGSIFLVALAEDCEIDVDAFYTIEAPLFEQVQGVKKGLIVNADGSLGWNTVDLTNKNCYWVPTKVEGTTVALKNLGTGKFLNGTGVADETVESTVKVLGLGQYNIVSNGTTVHANGHNGGVNASGGIVNWGGAAGSASAWSFVEHKDPDAAQEVKVTYNFVYDGNIKYSQTYNTLVGEQYQAITVTHPLGVSVVTAAPTGEILAEDIVVVDGVNTITKELELTISISNMPFETAASVDAITKWYYIRMHTNQPGYIGDVADNNTVNVAWGKASDSYNDNYVWGFVGDVFSGVKVVNKAGMQMTSTGSGNVTLTDEGTPFFVSTTSATGANATNGFCLRKNDSNNYLNANYSAGKLSHWGSTDAGSTFFLTEYEETEVTVGDANWATMYLGYSVYVPEGVNAYTISGVENGYVTKVSVEGVIPANTGVLLENAGTFTFKKAAKDVNALEGNLMNGSVEDTYVEGTAYVLSKPTDSEIGFYVAKLNKDAEGNEGTTHFLNNAGKAYLVLSVEQGTAAFYGFDWNGTTGIDEITENGVQSTVIYDLTGRRVEEITEPGIYIVGGKKVLVK